MPRIDPYRQQFGTAAGVPAVRAEPGAMADTGAEMLGGALSAAGRGIQRFGVGLGAIDNYLAEVELSTAQRKRDEIMVDYFRQITEEPDYERHSQIFQKALGEVSKIELKNPKAADAYRRDMDRLMPYWQSKLYSLNVSRKIKTIDADTRVNVESGLQMMQDALLDGRDDDALLARKRVETAIANREEMGLYSPAEAQAAREALDLAEQRTRVWVDALGRGSEKKGLAAIRQSELPASERESLERQFRTEWARQQADRLDAQEQAAEQERLWILDRMLDGTLTPDGIQKLQYIDAAEKYTWLTRLESHQQARLGGVEGKDDPKVHFDFMKRIHLGEPVTISEIIKADGLTLTTKDKLITDLRQRREGQTWADRLVYRRAIERIDRLHAQGYFYSMREAGGKPVDWKEADFEMQRINDSFREAAMMDLARWATENPDASDTEVQKKVDEVIYPVQQAAAVGVLQGWRKYLLPLLGPVGQAGMLYQIYKESKADRPTRLPWEGTAEEAAAADVLDQLRGRERDIWEKYKAEGMSPEEFMEVLRRIRGLPK